MEGGKKTQSGSSLTSDLFGSKNSASGSSSGIFGSLLTPPDKVLRQEYSLRSFESWKKDNAVNQDWTAMTGFPDNNALGNEGQSQSSRSKDRNSYFQEEKTKPKPCNYSSSIYYGGQDLYTFPESTKGSSFTTFNKYEAEDDSGMASRGNWWQGAFIGLFRTVLHVQGHVGPVQARGKAVRCPPGTYRALWLRLACINT